VHGVVLFVTYTFARGIPKNRAPPTPPGHLLCFPFPKCVSSVTYGFARGIPKSHRSYNCAWGPVPQHPPPLPPAAIPGGMAKLSVVESSICGYQLFLGLFLFVTYSFACGMPKNHPPLLPPPRHPGGERLREGGVGDNLTTLMCRRVFLRSA
jgi:hypothetical protein